MALLFVVLFYVYRSETRRRCAKLISRTVTSKFNKLEAFSKVGKYLEHYLTK